MAQQTTRENRRSRRIRRVQPVGFKQADSSMGEARKTVSANVSRGGMLLVTREDLFPPEGTWIDLMLQPSSGASTNANGIPGRIVHTRFSPEAQLRFAGLKFTENLSEDAARAIGLHSSEDNVVDALRTLQELEASFRGKVRSAPMVEAEEVSRPRTETPEPSLRDIPGPDLGVPLADINVEAERLRLEMEATVKQFLRATGPYLREWAERKVAGTVTKRHALSRAKGIEGLRALKVELRMLIEDYPTLIDTQLNGDELWAHRSDFDGKTDGTQSYYDEENEKPAMWLVDGFRRLMGFTGVLLIKHGFDELSKESDWAPLSHEQAVVAYRGRFAFSDEMMTILKRAAALYDAMAANDATLRDENETHARDAAHRLWDEA
ncbi:MAG: PilZ domain-containing protein [Candidatus Hydrogenedentes bacterium]|nr:PilZ domain-containing protein [Candidatus Hydrogenedentota bacterium]